MKSLFNSADAAEIQIRIDKINAETPALWGKMNASQMIKHCAIDLEYALGDRKGKQTFIGKMLSRFAKKKLLLDKPFAQNLLTSPDLVVHETPKNITVEQNKLKMLVHRFSSGPSAVNGNPSLFYGTLTPQEWDALMYKHLDHHLRQFGV
jgi:hypothetical protein